jgi:type IV secretion system protein VirB10
LPEELAELESLAKGAPTAQPFVIPTALPVPVAEAFPAQQAPSQEQDLLARRRLPAVVVDTGARSAGAPFAAGASTVAAGQSAPIADPRVEAVPEAQRRSAADEAFAARVGAAAPDTAQATVLANLGAIVPQGAMVPGVLETALNSDLPGFARAIVSRDVRSFDGTRVLIPRGSRAIGQYSSGVSAGQTRIFIVWTRLITPEGVSIQLASPGTDALGRGGLEGDVDRHFLERIGGALLLTIVGAAGAAVVDQPTTQVIIGATGGPQGPVAGQRDIPPTIKAPQGAQIRIFVARDLDFTAALAASGRR